MRFSLIIPLYFLLIISAVAQTRETVTFRYEGAPVGKLPFVSGSLPELGSSDLGKSVELLEVEDGVWEVDIELPVNREYTHQIFLRRVNQIEVPDPTKGKAVGDPVAASTPIVALEPDQADPASGSFRLAVSFNRL
ncbi:MAG: hypothetical protein ACI9R3_003643 [Verrucomicrobiales bacterium]|jgi:hypothetical protein